MAKYRFKFNGPGNHLSDGKMLKQGDEFEVPYDIRKRHADGDVRFTLVNKDSQKRRSAGNTEESASAATEEQDNLSQEARSSLEIVEKGGGWYDVVNKSTGEKVNESSLRYEDAVTLAGE